MTTPQDIENWLRLAFQDATIEVTGDGHHFEALLISKDFEGQNAVARHRMVYAALGDKMKAEIHALSLKTFSLSEVQNGN